MVCSACQDKPVEKACSTCGKLPPVLQIKSEECPVLFHTVELEGTREDNPPYIGMYKNTLLTYTADSAKFLFNSDGIYSTISGAVKFNEIIDRPKYDGVEMTSGTDIPDVNKAVAVESAARAAADAEIESKLNNTVMYDLEMNADATSVDFVEDKKNLFTGTTSTETDTIPLASETQAGILNAAGYQSIKNSQDRLDALAGGAVSVPNLPAEPTQAQLTNAWETATGLEEVFNRASIFDSTNGKNWTYFDNTSAWEVTGEINQTITLENFSLGQAGLIVGDNTDGKVYAEQDGTGSVYGWDALKSRVSNAESNITTLGTDKQDKLTAGANITIGANNVISATDTTYNDFTGTDGSSAGAAGLVPAPTISDVDKYLKSDGTWAAVSSGGGPSVVQDTGTSTTDVMSQVATTNMVYPAGSETSKTNIFIKGGGQGTNDYVCIGPAQTSGCVNTTQGATALGPGAAATGTRSIAIAGGAAQRQATGTESIALDGNATANYAIAIGGGSGAFQQNAIAIGHSSVAGTAQSIAIGYGASANANPDTIAIGENAKAWGAGSIAIGHNILVNSGTGGNGCVVIGNGAYNNTQYTTRNNEFCVHASTTANQPMVHSNVDTPTLGTDAANKNYVDTAIATAGAPVYTPSEFNTLWQEA